MDRYKRIKKTTSHYILKFGILAVLLIAFVSFGVLKESDKPLLYEQYSNSSNEIFYNNNDHHDDDHDDCKYVKCFRSL